MSGGIQSVGRSDEGSGVAVMITGEGVSAGLVGCSVVGLGGIEVGVAAAASSSSGWKGVGVGVASGGTVTRRSAVGVAAGAWLWAGKASHAVNRIRKSVSIERRCMAGGRDKTALALEVRGQGVVAIGV
jgi:hypothetical protein